MYVPIWLVPIWLAFVGGGDFASEVVIGEGTRIRAGLICVGIGACDALHDRQIPVVVGVGDGFARLHMRYVRLPKRQR